MLKTPSSRYGALKYNYGGYIPIDLTTLHDRKIQKNPPLSVDDYLLHLRGLQSDFVGGLLMRVDEDAEKVRLEREEEERKHREEDERRERERVEEEKQEKRRRMLAFQRGSWNVNILEYMAELRDASHPPAGGPIELETVDEEEGEVGRGGGESPLRLSPVTPSLLPDSIDIRRSQEELERIWGRLRMPVDQKVDMAVKYGSHRFAHKLGMAIQHWTAVSEHILTRETLLKEIEEFERTASDPSRFFQKGPTGSSETRLQEAREREDLMRRLHFVEARIEECVGVIRRELRESVTYEGAPYLEKMKWDYTEMIRRLQRER
ncbi:Coiled-coil domain-containing protein 87, partial [Rhizophlyctis rosea]